MNPQLLLGILIGMVLVLFCFGIFLAIPAKRTSKANLSFNEASLEQLTERNAIGHDQRAALWTIAGYLAPKDTRAADRKARRERIATAVMQSIVACFDGLPAGIVHPDELKTNCARYAATFADALIAELDKPEL